ncbi:MAG: DUF418 domain-containing protein [Methanobacteriota archaeon]
MTATAVVPAHGRERIDALDVLRGFALLGILVMNVQAFSMPIAAYFNPTVYGSLEAADGVVWLLGHLLVDQKFITLFSLLFGAGVLLFCDRIEARGGRSGPLHYRRMGWLLVIGLAHAYLLWYGDVLAIYAVCALLLYPLRKRSPRALALAGLALIAVVPVIFTAMGATFSAWPADLRHEVANDWAPDEATLAAELAAYRGGWLEQMAHRVPESLAIHTMFFATWLFWRTTGLMLLGMAFLKWGVLSAARSRSFYARLAVAGYAIGLPVVAVGVLQNFAHGWMVEYSMFFGFQFNYWGSLAVAAGHLGLVMLVATSGALPWVRRRLSEVGRTAFTNYLLQTLVATTIFYGHGFGLFGEVSRTGQIGIFAAIVVAEVALSAWWLARFRFGPFEWAWRSLTYLRLQPIRIASPTPVVGVSREVGG